MRLRAREPIDGGRTSTSTTSRNRRLVRCRPPGCPHRAAVAVTKADDPAAAVASTAIVPGAVHRTSLAISATYDVHVRLAVATRRLKGSVTITARNRSGAGIDRLELNTVMARLGALDLGPVTVDGTRRKATIDDQTIVVPLGGTLPDGASATVVVPFTARLRSTLGGSSWLFTRANGIVDMHRWIPWVSRKRRFDRPNHGDPFVTPVSPRVTVRIRTDVPLRFANTGDRISASADGLTRTFRATNVRDFVITAAADYRTTEARVGDTLVRVVSRPGFPASATLSAAVNAVRKLEAKLGPYPYRVLKVVQSAGRYGMEGPGVAWIPTGTPSGNLRYLVTHEIAHQWFYGMVGNDQAREPVRRRGRHRLRRPPGPRAPPRLPLRDGRPRPPDLRLLGDLLLRGRLHPGRQPARQRPPEDGLGGLLDGAPRLRRRPAMAPQPHADPARRPRRGHALEPAIVVEAPVPHPLLGGRRRR